MLPKTRVSFITKPQITAIVFSEYFLLAMIAVPASQAMGSLRPARFSCFAEVFGAHGEDAMSSRRQSRQSI
jgi:hypothetical protein